MKAISTLVATFGAVVGLASSHHDGKEFVVFETRPSVSASSWTMQGPAPATSSLKLHMILQIPHQEIFEQTVLNISTPGHPQYGKFLSREELKDFHRPSADVLDTMFEWLKAGNLTDNDYRLASLGDEIDLTVTVAQAQFLFNTTFFIYTRGDTALVRAEEYSLPTSIRSHVKTVVPIVRLPEVSAHSRTLSKITQAPEETPPLHYDPAYCNRTITPACLKGLYEMDDSYPPQSDGGMLGISGYLNQSVRMDDLHNFIAYFAPNTPQPFPKTVTTGNFSSPNPDMAPHRDTVEAALDVQYSSSIASGIPITFYSTPGLAEQFTPDLDQPDPATMQNEPYLTQLEYLLALPDSDLPSVLSTSYGENEQSVPFHYAVHICQRIGALTARGVSVIFSSGDTGPGVSCVSNDGRGVKQFQPIFPASCPLLTSVGGTKGVEPEYAAEFSSGGFSNYFGPHYWQNASLAHWFQKNGAENHGYYISKGRGFPDVAAQSENFIIRDHGINQAVSGTSASAPVFAAMIANINAVRRSKGLGNLGFLNPWLYLNASSAFTDIVNGKSVGCTGVSAAGLDSAKIPDAGWRAVEGWDPVTGLGTPIWPKLLEAGMIASYKPCTPEFCGDHNGPATNWNFNTTAHIEKPSFGVRRRQTRKH